MSMNFTPVDLERALCQNVSLWTKDMLFKNPQDPKAKHGPVGLNVYQGHIPSYQAGPRSEAVLPKAPSCAIKTLNFSYKRLDGICTINFLIVTWDDALTRRGYIDVQNIMNRIVYGLRENEMIDQSFPLLDEPIHGELIDDPAMDAHPYYLGTIQAKFGIMSPGPGLLPPGLFGYTDTGEYNDTGSDTLPVVAPEPLPT
jgi:hypothetical protein